MAAAERQREIGPGQRDVMLLQPDAKLLAECNVDRFRASGPGGQKRNKTESAVRLRHAPTGLIAIGTESRSQHENRARALVRLRVQIALELRESIDLTSYDPPAHLAALLARGAAGVGERTRRSVEYLAGVAALLDVLAAAECSVRDAARVLGSSTGALSRLLLVDERVARKVNELRAARGQRPLR